MYVIYICMYIYIYVCVLVVGRNPRWDICLFPSNLVVRVGPGEERIVVLGIYQICGYGHP